MLKLMYVGVIPRRNDVLLILPSEKVDERRWMCEIRVTSQTFFVNIRKQCGLESYLRPLNHSQTEKRQQRREDSVGTNISLPPSLASKGTMNQA